MPLTDTTIRNSKAKEKQYKLSDQRGLYLLVGKTGRKYFRFDYRFMGKRKTLALGVYPDVSLADARQKRDDARYRQFVKGKGKIVAKDGNLSVIFPKRAHNPILRAVPWHRMPSVLSWLDDANLELVFS